MKRSKKIYILLLVLILACAATFGVMQYEEYKEKISNSDEIILEISPDSVQALSWEYESETLAFHKDEKWLYDGDENFPVNEDRIKALLEQFEAFGVSFIIEEVEDYGQYGLDDPICTISLETEEESYEILLGDYSAMDSERYVSIGDGNVYLVQNDPLDYFDATLADMIEHDEVPSLDVVTEIQFAGAENYSITYEEDSADTYCEEDVYFTEQNGKKVPLDTSSVKGYLSGIQYLSLADFVAYNVTDEELEEYGLDEPELTVTVAYVCTSENEDGEEEEVSDTFILNISRDPEEKAAAEEAAAEEDGEENEETDEEDEEEEITAYARIGDSQIVYMVSSDDYLDLMEASYDDLRHQEVLTADFRDIYEIEISLEGNEYTITSEKDDEERVYYYQEEELDIDDLELALNNLTAARFTDEQPDQQEEISLTVYLDNENYPQVRIELYRYDGSNCLAAVDGEPVSLVGRSKVVDLIEAVHAIVLN